MEALGTGVSQTKLGGFSRQRIKHRSYRETKALNCNVIHASHSSDKEQQPFSKSSELFPLFYHAPLTRSGRFMNTSTRMPAKDRKNKGKQFYSSEACTFDENVAGNSSTTAQEKVGVLLLNLGGPDTLQDVQPFLFNLFADPDIIRLPRLFRFLQRPLAQLISVVRAPKSKEGYASIGGGSPLRRITNEQAHALKLALEEKNLHTNVYIAMRYW